MQQTLSSVNVKIRTEPLAESLAVRQSLDVVWLPRSSDEILHQSVAGARVVVGSDGRSGSGFV